MVRSFNLDYLRSFRYGLQDVTGDGNVFSNSKDQGHSLWDESHKHKYVGLSEIAGISLTGDIEEVKPLNSNIAIPYVVGVSYGTLSIGKGVLSNNNDFANWLFSAVNGINIAGNVRRILQVDVLDIVGERIINVRKSYRFFNCIPSEIRISDLDATSNEILIESLEILFTHYDIAFPKGELEDVTGRGILTSRQRTERKLVQPKVPVAFG